MLEGDDSIGLMCMKTERKFYKRIGDISLKMLIRKRRSMKYSIKVNEVRNGSENVRGIASVTLGDSFKLRSITIVNDPREQGKVFVSMPSYKSGPEGEFKDIFYPTTKEFHDELTENVAKNSFTVEFNKSDRTMPKFNVRVTPYEKEGSSIRGMASINFEGMVVNNVTIQQGKNGLFVAMPSYKTSQTDEQGKPVYKNVCYPVTAKFKEKLDNVIIQVYENAREQANTKDSVLDKLSENSEVVGQKDQVAKTQRKTQGKEQNQPSQDNAR